MQIALDGSMSRSNGSRSKNTKVAKLEIMKKRRKLFMNIPIHPPFEQLSVI
jgi:hypothetical protein